MCTIRGVVTDYSTGQPLARTHLMANPISAITAKAQTSAYADESGAFTFPSLPPGVYYLAAERRHYARYEHGAANWDSRGTPIVLEPGASFFASIRLRKLGVITGRVFDQNQVGLEDHSVIAYRLNPSLAIAGRARTDDRGVYRLTDLKPGRYLVRTGARQLSGGPGLLPTFFKDSASRRDAQELEVHLDEEVQGIDIRPAVGRLFSLTGTVSGPLPAKVTLLADIGVREVTAQPSLAGGEFTIEGLPPGTYQLLAESGQGPSYQVAQQTVTLASDGQHVSLQLAPAPEFQLRCRNASGQPAGRADATAYLRRLDLEDSHQETLQCGDRRKLAPGVYEARVAAAGNSYVKSLAGGHYSREAYEFTASARQPSVLTVELGSNPSTIRGTVRTSDGQPAVGAPVYLRPVDDDLYVRAGGTRYMRAGGNGEFAFVSMPPGRYELLSSFEVEELGDIAWSGMDVKTVDVAEKEDTKVEVTLSEPGE